MPSGYWAAVVQAQVDVITDPTYRDDLIDRNRQRAMRVIDHHLSTSATPATLFQFPVLMLQGAYNERRDEAARYAVSITLPGPEIEPLIAFCAARNVYIASSCVERHPKLPGWFFHSGFVLGPQGLLIRYPKAQARSAQGVKIIKDHYAEYVAAVGEEAVFPVAATPIGVLATMVEAEILVPEVSRQFASKGAEVLLHPTVERPQHPTWAFDSAKVARAFENRLFVVSANVGVAVERNHATGVAENRLTRGGSRVIDFSGRVLTAIDGPGEALATAYIDLDALRHERTRPAPETEFAPILYQNVYRVR